MIITIPVHLPPHKRSSVCPFPNVCPVDEFVNQPPVPTYVGLNLENQF